MAASGGRTLRASEESAAAATATAEPSGLPPSSSAAARAERGREGVGTQEELETVLRNPKQMRREEIKQSGDCRKDSTVLDCIS